MERINYSKKEIADAITNNSTGTLSQTNISQYDNELQERLNNETEFNSCDICGDICHTQQDLYWLEDDYIEPEFRTEYDNKVDELFEYEENSEKWGNAYPCAFCHPCLDSKPVKQISDEYNAKPT